MVTWNELAIIGVIGVVVCIGISWLVDKMSNSDFWR